VTLAVVMMVMMITMIMTIMMIVVGWCRYRGRN
jgi:hypothetical protein